MAATGTARTSQSTGENIQHFGAVRMRLTGSGTLLMSLRSLDNEISQTLVPFTMKSTTGREPTRLCNFMSQRAFLEIGTTEFQEYFRINRIVIFSKELWSSYPGIE